MYKYYATINLIDNSISKGQCPCSGENIVCIEISQDIYNNIEKYIYVNNELILDPDYEAKQEAKRQDEINHLTMTALDFITVLRSAGLTLEQINLVIESNLEVKMQLTYCQNVFCGVVKQFLPMTVGDITITPEMIEQAFIAKHNSDTEEV